MAIDPGRHSLYATNFSHGTGTTVWIIDTTTGAVTGTVGVGLAPSEIAVDTNTHRAYVTNAGNNASEDTVSVIDTTSQQVTATVHVAPGPFWVAVDEGAHTAYVTNGQTSNNGYGSGTASVIDTSTLQVTATIDVGAEPYAVAVDEGTHTAYVANDGFGTGHTVTVIAPSATTSNVSPTTVTPPAGATTNPSPTTAPTLNARGYYCNKTTCLYPDQSEVPDYKRCGVACGEPPTSADIQSGRAAEPSSTPTTPKPCIDCPPPGSVGNSGGPRSRGVHLMSCPRDQELGTGMTARRAMATELHSEVS